MSQLSRRDYIALMRGRYRRAGRLRRIALLNETCEVCGYERKYAIKLLTGNVERRPGQRGRKRGYDEIAVALKTIWLASDQMCGKRLAKAIPLWLPFYEAHHGPLCAEQKAKLLKISPAQIDRLLAGARLQAQLKARTPKPGSLLARDIPLSADSPRPADQPGWIETDTVAHCGGDMSGSFVWSITYTCPYSGWTENRAVWRRSTTGLVEQTRDVEAALPFAIAGLDFDNGGEYLNEQFIAYCREHIPPIPMSRSRAYRKNDNAHVEQKNWTHVRELLGYERFKDPRLVALLNDLYKTCWGPFHNFFHPSMKLIGKVRIGSRYRKRYDQAQTPCERLLRCPLMSHAQKEALRHQRDQLDPFLLKRGIEEKLAVILDIVGADMGAGACPRSHVA
jgi:hypothetical protein